jgi:hypothetical protein
MTLLAVSGATVAAAFTDWASIGKAQQAPAADADFRSVYAGALKVVELRERSRLVTEDL